MIATTLGEVLGRTIALVPVDEQTVEGALAGMGVPEALVPVFIEGNRLIAGSTFDQVHDDVRYALTGRPRRSLADFVAHHAAAFSPGTR